MNSITRELAEERLKVFYERGPNPGASDMMIANTLDCLFPPSFIPKHEGEVIVVKGLGDSSPWCFRKFVEMLNGNYSCETESAIVSTINWPIARPQTDREKG